MRCKCGNQSKLIEFQTFSYYYCDTCKIEVTEDHKQVTDEYHGIWTLSADPSTITATTNNNIVVDNLDDDYYTGFIQLPQGLPTK